MRNLLPLLAALCSGTALAQQVELQPSPSQQCLQHVDGEDQRPDYPYAEYNGLRAGRVQATFEFSAPDRAPEVTLLLQEGGEPFVEAVRAHARGLRVPCLPKGAAPVQLRKDYIFSPGRPGTASSETENPNHKARAAMLRCVRHAEGWSKPEYPRWAQRANLQGRVVVKARYANATDPPEVDVYSRPYATRLADEVKDWIKDTRLPCHSGEPVTAIWTYNYVFEGDRYGFRAPSFRQYLGLVKGIRERTLQMDTQTMACPFDVQISYRQPYLPNQVVVIGERTPERRPLLDWLAAAELDLGRAGLDAVWADELRMTIPCLKIDLNPKEKTS